MGNELFLPGLDYWLHGNRWSGSFGAMRFWIEPKDGVAEVEVWSGPMSREQSTVEESTEFPIDEAGLAALRGWLEEQAQRICQA